MNQASEPVETALSFLRPYHPILARGHRPDFLARMIVRSVDAGYDKFVTSFIRDAERGDRDADQALVQAASSYAAAGRPLAPVLASYALTRRSGRRGRSANSTTLRDLYIAMAVLHVLDTDDVAPTRNRDRGSKADGLSACAAVQAALAILQIHMTEPNVERIWNDRKDDPATTELREALVRQDATS